MRFRQELRETVRNYKAEVPVNLHIFGPQGSGKTSFIRTCFRALLGARNLPNRFVSPTRTARLGECVPVEPCVVKRASYEDDRAAWEAQEMPAVAGQSVVEFDYRSG